MLPSVPLLIMGSLFNCGTSGSCIIKYLMNSLPKNINTIIGTKWCGPGNNFTDINDLGTAKELDACCRDHDLCEEYILSGQSAYNLKNTGMFTRSHCECDETLHSCLKEAGKEQALPNIFGDIYFNIIKMKCFRKKYPIVGCKKFTASSNRCVEYEFNTSGEKKWQWFRNPDY